MGEPIPVTESTQNQINKITREQFLEVVGHIAGDGWTLAKVGKEMAIPKAILWIAIHNNPEWDLAYARALQIKQDHGLEADDTDVMELMEAIKTEEYPPKLLNSLVNAVKLKIETRHWSMERLNRQKYGQKLDISSTVSVTHEVGPGLTALSQSELQTMLQLQRKASGLNPDMEIKPLSVQAVQTKNIVSNNPTPAPQITKNAEIDVI